MELLFYTDTSGQPNNINTVEILNGQPSTSFKDGASGNNTLCCLQNDYVISALPRKSVLNVFELNRHSQQSQKIVTPGVVKALCVSLDGFHIAAGIEERVLVWNAISGELVAALAKHYQAVTQLCFTSDCSFLVSSGQDGLIVVWDMASAIDLWSNDSTDPTFCLSCHSLPVTHLWCSVVGGARSRLYSSSLDRTIKIHDLAQGVTLLTLVYSIGITSFCVDSAETLLLAGGHDGMLFKVDLISSTKTVNDSNISSLNIENKKDGSCISFKGHSQAITCITFNYDCTVFVTGSIDKDIKFWDVLSNQNTRTINCKSGVTNLYITFTPPGLTSTDYKPRYPFPKLSRSIVDPHSDEQPPKILRLDEEFVVSSSKESSLRETIDNCLTKSITEDALAELQTLKKEVSNLKEINRKIVDFTVDNLLVNK